MGRKMLLLMVAHGDGLKETNRMLNAERASDGSWTISGEKIGPTGVTPEMVQAIAENLVAANPGQLKANRAESGCESQGGSVVAPVEADAIEYTHVPGENVMSITLHVELLHPGSETVRGEVVAVATRPYVFEGHPNGNDGYFCFGEWKVGHAGYGAASNFTPSEELLRLLYREVEDTYAAGNLRWPSNSPEMGRRVIALHETGKVPWGADERPRQH